MNQEEIIFDLTGNITKSLTTIQVGGLKNILTNFRNRIDQINSGNTIAFNVMHRGLRHYKTFRYWMEESIKIPGFKKKNPEHQKELGKLMAQRFKNDLDDNYEQALKYVQSFRDEDQDFKEASYYQALNSIVNVWTAFESNIKELWIYCLDNYPKLFLNEVLRYQSHIEVNGIEGKNISIALLAKYNFNISNCLGQLLNPKYDFTSLNGMKKSFHVLIGDENGTLELLDTPELNQLEIIRHLIVHRAGIIDHDYLRRTLKTTEKIGDRLAVTSEELRSYGNSCIQPMIKFTHELDNKILKADKLRSKDVP